MSTPKPPKRSADFIKRAYEVFHEAIRDAPSQIAPDDTPPPEPEKVKDPAAVSLGRRGGLKGGPARAAKLTAEERSEIGKKAAAKRWGKD